VKLPGARTKTNPLYWKSLPLCGLTSGIFGGLIASEVFIFGLGIITGILSKNLAEVVAIVVFGQLIGTLPALMIGLIFGTITGLLFRLIPINFSRLTGALVGILINILLGVGLNVAAGLIFSKPNLVEILNIPYSQQDIHWFSLPVMLFIAAAGWGGINLAKCKSWLKNKPAGEQRPPVN
jgi:hypothetical protein